MISIIIPVYNESKNIVKLIKEIELCLANKDYEIIIIDDSSIDDTVNVIKNLKKIKVKILKNKYNKGQSFCINRGIINSKYNTIITIDGDGQNNPKDIIRLLNMYNSNEEIYLVGGIRKKRRDSYVKVFSSIVANYVRSKFLRDNCKDTGCALKVFDKKIYLQFPYFNGIHRFLPALFKGYGYNTIFLKVDHRQREFGYSNYGIGNRLFRGIRDMIKVRNIIKRNQNHG